MLNKGCVTDILEDKAALVWSPTFSPFCELRGVRVRQHQEVDCNPTEPPYR